MFDQDLLCHLAKLSKIHFTTDELSQLAKEMTDIVSLMDRVKDFQADVEPFTPAATSFSSFRDDSTLPSSTPEEILANAKDKKSGTFTVPKVV